jgi:hypothetical protein
MIKELYSRNWDFTLYQANDRIVITVAFFGFVDSFKSFFLQPEEFTTDFESLKNLSENIRNNYEAYKHREITPAITREKID